MGTAFQAETITGDKVTIVEKVVEYPDRGLQGMIFVADDGTEYVTVGSEATLLIEKDEAENPVEFEPGAPEPEASTEEATGEGSEEGQEASQAPPES